MKYNGNGRPIHSCICTKCGNRSDSTQLCFDFSQLFKAELEKDCDKNLETMITKVINACTNHHRGPTLLSEQDLIDWTVDHRQTSSGSSSGVLRVPAEEWKARAVKGLSKLGLSNGDITAWEKFIQEKEFDSGNVLELAVSYLKIDPGDIRISKVEFPGSSNPLLTTRYCPCCGEEMSYWSGRFPELVLTVVGGPRISKSTALAACAAFFLDHEKECGITWEGNPDDRSWETFLEDCVDRYRSNERLDATRTGGHASIPHFSVLVKVKGVDRRMARQLILTVVDLPGEYDTDAEGQKVQFNPALYEQYKVFYQNVDCVWYCTDKAELEELDIGKSEQARTALGYEEGRGMIRTAERVRKLAEYAAMFRKDVLAVFLLGKSDFLQEYPDFGSLYRKGYDLRNGNPWITVPVNSSPVFRGRQYHEKARRLRRLLESRNPDLVHGFEDAFQARTYIATSNYGHAFDIGGDCSLSPYQTELPFLWLLAAKGYLMVQDGRNETYAKGGSLAWQRLCLYEDRRYNYGMEKKERHSFYDWIMGRK